jgi:preprotein translocase subunit Sec61beta
VNKRTIVLAVAAGALLNGGLWAAAPPAQAIALSQDSAPEQDIKAAFLRNFARFTEWPERAFSLSPGEFHLGLLGPDSMFETLQRVLKDKTVGNRALKVIRGKVPSDLKSCAMVFVADAEKGQIPALLAEFKGQPVLTVGETEGFAEDGGILNFYIEQNKVQFEINPDAAERAGLKVTKLVVVANRKVKDRKVKDK